MCEINVLFREIEKQRGSGTDKGGGREGKMGKKEGRGEEIEKYEVEQRTKKGFDRTF